MSRSKLVRDKVPQIVRESGAEPLIRVADDDEYPDLLRAKLVEEVNEFLASGDPWRTGRRPGGLLTLAASQGVDRDHLEELRTAKASERGGFAERIVWSGNAPGDPECPAG